MSNAKDGRNARDGEQEIDDELWEMLEWTDGLRESGIVSDSKIADSLGVHRVTLGRVLRNERWSPLSTVRSGWLKRREVLLPLDADGLLSYLAAMKEGQSGTTTDITDETDGGAESGNDSPAILSGSAQSKGLQSQDERIPPSPSRETPEQVAGDDIEAEEGDEEAQDEVRDRSDERPQGIENDAPGPTHLPIDTPVIVPEAAQSDALGTDDALQSPPTSTGAVEQEMDTESAAGQSVAADDMPQNGQQGSGNGTSMPTLLPIVPITEQTEESGETREFNAPTLVQGSPDGAAVEEQEDGFDRTTGDVQGDVVERGSAGSVAVQDDSIDDRRNEAYGEPGSRIKPEPVHLSSVSPADREWLLEQIRDAKTIEEVASLVSASVLNWVPGLTLEQAKEAATERLGGWNPANPRVKPLPYLTGDAPLLLWSGREVSYRDEGARRVAFAATLKWQGEMPYCAQQMRHGIPSTERERRYAFDSHAEKGRGLLLGYRLCGWVPEKPYPDHGWFFGSEGNLRSDGTWWPSRAEAIAYWYFLRELYQAYRGTEAERTESIWFCELEKAMTRTERFLLDEDYRLTIYYHGKGRVIPHHTRIAERRWMAKRIAELVQEIARKRSRRRLKRFLTAPFRALAKPLIRSRANSASRKFFAAQLAKAAAEAQANRQAVTPSGEEQSSAPVLIEVQPEVCGELDWKALDPPWHKRDRTRWYEDGTGPLSSEGAVIRQRMQVLDAS